MRTAPAQKRASSDRHEQALAGRYFDLRGKPLDELLEDPDAIAGLGPDMTWPPIAFKRSLDYTFTFPAQELRLGTGVAEDPTTGTDHNVVADR